MHKYVFPQQMILTDPIHLKVTISKNHIIKILKKSIRQKEKYSIKDEKDKERFA